MPKRHSIPQDASTKKNTKRPRNSDVPVVSSADSDTAKDHSTSVQISEDTPQDAFVPMTISPALLSGGESSATKVPGGIRRRMNAESLAGRLGNELVVELESLLAPGMTEMPSFAVRQEIQQRYNVDRRHIYDWFHNRGLRVTSAEQREEKRAKAQSEREKVWVVHKSSHAYTYAYTLTEPHLVCYNR